MSIEAHAAGQYGLTPSEYRLYVSVHELGHAVAGITAGYDYRKVEVHLDKNGNVTGGIAAPSKRGPRDRFPHLVAIHGGFVASEMHLRNLGLWDSHREQLATYNARADYANADRYKPSRRETQDAISQARRHLEQHWTVIDYLAPELVKKGRLSFRQLRSVPGW